VENNDTVSNAPSFKSRTVARYVPYSPSRKRTLKNWRRKSFASNRTLKLRLPRNDTASVRKLIMKKRGLEAFVKKYRSVSGTTADLCSYLFLGLGEAMEEDVKAYFWDAPKASVSEEFRRILKGKIKDVGLNEFDMDDAEDYVLEMTYFIEWLTDDLVKKHRNLKEDVETYAKHLAALIDRVLTKGKKEFLKKASKVEPEETNDFKSMMSAFHKAHI